MDATEGARVVAAIFVVTDVQENALEVVQAFALLAAMSVAQCPAQAVAFRVLPSVRVAPIAQVLAPAAAHLALAAPMAVPAVSLAEAVPDAADSAEDPASQDAPEVAGHPASRPAHQHVTTPAPVRVLR